MAFLALLLAALVLMPGVTEVASPVAFRYERPGRFAEIDRAYQSDVRPILEARCFDCHGRTITWPWYHVLPFVGRMMDEDRQAGLDAVDFTDGFPFRGARSPELSLMTLQGVTQHDLMPPWRYRIVHWHSTLTPAEVDVIAHWVQASLPLLKK